MQTITVSTKGQVIIPKALRDLYNLEPGTELYITNSKNGILLKPKRTLPTYTIDDLAAFIPYNGPRKSLEDMEAGIQTGIQEEWGDCS
ncbi:MAG: AbrB/MazE/SpoVT family DNA-binding domain-containing protein [Candidatus Promineifilaceae bacterium]